MAGITGRAPMRSSHRVGYHAVRSTLHGDFPVRGNHVAHLHHLTRKPTPHGPTLRPWPSNGKGPPFWICVPGPAIPSICLQSGPGCWVCLCSRSHIPLLSSQNTVALGQEREEREFVKVQHLGRLSRQVSLEGKTFLQFKIKSSNTVPDVEEAPRNIPGQHTQIAAGADGMVSGSQGQMTGPFF